MKPIRLAELFIYATAAFFVIMVAVGLEPTEALHRAVAGVNINIAKLAILSGIAAMQLDMKDVRAAMLVGCAVASVAILSGTAWWILAACGLALLLPFKFRKAHP